MALSAHVGMDAAAASLFHDVETRYARLQGQLDTITAERDTLKTTGDAIRAQLVNVRLNERLNTKRRRLSRGCPRLRRPRRPQDARRLNATPLGLY